jgi:hypothetical protein
MHLFSIPKKFGIAVVAVFAVVAMTLGLTVSANATTKSGSDAGCIYNVSDDNFQTFATAEACSTVQAFLTYRTTLGTPVVAKTPVTPNSVGTVAMIWTAQVTGPNTITDNYAVYNPGRGGVPSFTISTRH